VPGDVGAACGTDAPCTPGLNCVAASTAAATTCQAAAGAAGAACGAGTAGCDGHVGLYCGGAAGARTCAPITYGGDGAACGLLADGTRAGCKAGQCYTASGLSIGGELGTCKSYAADGAACDATLGPPCAAPARCVPSGGDGTAGTCTVPDATACG
jgi:hypothetical protein